MPLASYEAGFRFSFGGAGFRCTSYSSGEPQEKRADLCNRTDSCRQYRRLYRRHPWLLAGVCFFVDFSSFTPFPFTLGIDRLSAFFLLLICTVAVPVAIFAVSYFDRHCPEQRRNWMWAFFSLFLLSMIVVVTASTGFAFLVGWELMTLLSAGLILMEGDSI